MPFAGSQGGKKNKATLYGEVKDVIEKDGYLHQGMRRILEDAKIGSDITDMTKKVNDIFDDIVLCGPRMFLDPSMEEKWMCEIFYPYEHLLKAFSDGFSIALSKQPKSTSFWRL